MKKINSLIEVTGTFLLDQLPFKAAFSIELKTQFSLINGFIW
ncbi:hypothetical protein [Bacillus sp. OK048]|nr:hypothetical protein [Bacillus sp. OK048]